ncbi:MAG: hypothetical protein KDK00_14145 [Rhodobacteraceae bacterium]|nr:hypothetical protein [Paracoccaceae bacterium]
MQKTIWLSGLIAVSLAACEPYETTGTDPSDQFIKALPEGVLAIAAPKQDLTAVRIDPSDGCYVYRYVGPVETTFLPLRTLNGSPICSRPQ